ncbi:MAG: T9SS type A sorting domain-containing protein [Bacteroidetes bacterium]|nr:T9SS type A sorting domain-containing protein [Bacteroidota bacterium]
MKSLLSSLIFIFLILVISTPTFATMVTSNGTGGGDWDDASSWSPSGVPGCVDTISILAGDVIEITTQQDYESCGPIIILVYGTILFPENGSKLKLPCGSSVEGLGGLISAPGDDNSNKISICTEWVWESDEADMSGSFSLRLGALPITLVSFEAEIDNTTVLLKWTTAAEINNDYFTIERSTNGLSFEELGKIQGSGNSNVLKKYVYSDKKPLKGISYYRLKQTDFDGKFEYFKLVTANLSETEDGICLLNVYPNPCTGNCTINLDDCPLSSNEVDVQLYDAAGNKITNRIQPKNSDSDVSFHINTANNLSPGVYIVRAKTGNKLQTQKVIIK